MLLPYMVPSSNGHCGIYGIAYVTYGIMESLLPKNVPQLDIDDHVNITDDWMWGYQMFIDEFHVAKGTSAVGNLLAHGVGVTELLEFLHSQVQAVL